MLCFASLSRLAYACLSYVMPIQASYKDHVSKTTEADKELILCIDTPDNGSNKKIVNTSRASNSTLIKKES